MRDYSTERAFRQLVRQHDLAHVPTVLLKQFVELGARSSQFNRKIRELEKEADDKWREDGRGCVGALDIFGD